MSFRGFARGRGYGPQGTRAKGPFVRPCFPPFRHIGPPRPGCPGPFMPRHPNNFFQPPLRGNPQFRPRGRGRKFYNYDDHFAGSNQLPINPDCEETVMPPPPIFQPAPLPVPPNGQNIGNNEIDSPPQQFLPSSEEEEQSVMETAENDCVESEGNIELNSEPPELDVAYNDLNDIDNSEMNVLQHVTDELSVTSDINNDVILGGPEDGSQLDVMSSHQEIDLENMPNDNECIEAEIPHESVDDTQNLEQSVLCESSNFENELLQADLQCQYDAPDDNILQVECDQQQDILEEIETLTETDIVQDIVQEPNVCEAPILQDAPLSYDSTGQETLPENLLQDAEEPMDLESEDTAASPCIHTDDLDNDNCPVSTPLSTNTSTSSNVALHEQHRLSQAQEKSFNNGPPTLSPHPELQLPADFDPTTPPPVLLKQDQPSSLSPFPVFNLPPMFNPAEPPPNMRHLFQSNVITNVPAWNSSENQMPGIFNNMDMHRDLNIPAPCSTQQLEMPNQSNVFLAPPIDAMNYTPINYTSILPGDPGIATNIPPPLSHMQQPVSSGTYIPPVSAQEVVPFSTDCTDSNLDTNKDDGLDDIQEAMKFAKEMTNMIEDKEEGTTAEDHNLIKLTDDIESISLPPGKPRAEKIKSKKKQDDAYGKDVVVSEEQTAPAGETVQDVCLESKDESLVERPKVVFNLSNVSNKAIKTNTNWEPSTDKTKSPKKKVKIQNERTVDPKVKASEKKTKKMLEKVPEKMSEKRLERRSERRLERRSERRLEKRSEKVPEKMSERIFKRSQNTVETAATSATSPVNRKNVKNTLKKNKEEANTSTKDGSGFRHTISPARRDTAVSQKKSERIVEKSPRASVLPYQVQRSLRSRMEKNWNPGTEASWKNKIVNRFLKMSKNEIYNMVNNTSLRKFDVIMKRLVREKRSMLSLEMRHAQDEKMKQDDQQEFMKQLNAMLEPGATVGITDLPTEFIHHLNEVLQLDIPLDKPLGNNEELATTSNSQGSHPEGTSNIINPIVNPIVHNTDIANNATVALSDVVDPECVRSKSFTSKASHDKDASAHSAKINDFTMRDDAYSTKSNKSSASSRLSALQHDLDDIFSEVTRKNQIPTAAARKDCSTRVPSAKKADNDARRVHTEEDRQQWEEDKARRTENCARWVERCDKWKMKEQEDPLAYRNLTKEEWEAKYGTAAIPAEQPSAAVIFPFIGVGSKQMDATAGTSGDDWNSPNRALAKALREDYPRRRHSSESSKHSQTKQKTVDNEKHKKHRRHSDERRQAAEGSVERHNRSRNSSSSSSSSSNNNGKSSDSDTNTNVTKLLRAIKEKEKVAKKMSLSETIRDEVNAEIERERKQKSKKSRKSHKKSKSRKEKRARHKKNKKQKKNQQSSSDTSSQEEDEGEGASENEEEEPTRLLTEGEIKKEMVDEVVVKQEVDTDPWENDVRNFEPPATSVATGHRAMAKAKAAPLPAESHHRPESASSVREMLAVAVDTVQSHIEDTPSAASPSQLKTKAQLKQMPETTVNQVDSRASPSTGSGVSEGGGSDTASALKVRPDDPKKHHEQAANVVHGDHHQTANVICDTNEPEVSPTTNDAATSCGETTDNTMQVPADQTNENTMQLAATACASVETPDNAANMPADREVPSSADVSGKTTTVVASASPVSGSSTASTASSKQGTSKKIDIKTYYERSMHRRLSSQVVNPPKQPTEGPAATQASSSPTPKAAEADVKINRPMPISSSIKDPRLIYSKRSAVIAAANESNTAQTASGKSIQPEAQQTKAAENVSPHCGRYPATERSEAAGPALTRSDGSDGDVKKVHKRKAQGEKSPTVAVDALPNVATTPTATASKLRKRPTAENLTDKTSPSTAPSDPKRFKNIRSEGSKELRLKKEMAKAQKMAKKPKSALKSPCPALTKEHQSKAEADDANKTAQEGQADNTTTTDTSKANQIEIERATQSSASPRADNTSHDNAETKPAKSSPENVDNNDESPRNFDEANERSLKSRLAESRDAKQDVANIATAGGAPETLFSQITQNEKTRDVVSANDTASVEITNEEGAEEETSDNAAESTALETCSQTEVSTEISARKDEKNLASPGEIQRSNATKDTGIASSRTNQIEPEKLNEKNLLESKSSDPASAEEHDTSGPDVISHLDGAEGKDNRPLADTRAIHSIDINGTNENNMRPDVACEAANMHHDDTPLAKTVELAATNDDSAPPKAAEGNVSSPDSVGSPFKGFLQESILSFEPPFVDFDIDEMDAGKEGGGEFLLDRFHANCVTDTDDRAEIEIERRRPNETAVSVANFANVTITTANGGLSVTLDDALFAWFAGKEFATDEKSGKSDSTTACEGRVECPQESPREVPATTLHEDDVCAGENNESEERLTGDHGYTTNAGLAAAEESAFLHEEEIQGDDRAKDLASKLTSGTDPSLSDALDTAASDEALKLPEMPADNLNHQIYLETSEKISCDKLPSFGTAEHLDNDMFYLDDRLQSTSAFDHNKDDAPVHFSDHRQSPQYDDTPAITPEATKVAPYPDLSHVEMQEVAPVNRPPSRIESPKVLIVPTKAALKVTPLSNLLPKPRDNIPIPTERVDVSERTQQSETNEQSDRTLAWHLNVHNTTKTQSQELQENTTLADKQEFVCVGETSSARLIASNEASRENVVNPSVSSTSNVNTDKNLLAGLRRNPVVELMKMKELDRLMEKKTQKRSERTKDAIHKSHKRENAILHKLEGRRIKYRSKHQYRPHMKSLVKKLRLKQSEKPGSSTKETILARMMEIDVQMHELTKEKLKLHNMLQKEMALAESTASHSSVAPSSAMAPSSVAPTSAAPSSAAPSSATPSSAAPSSVKPSSVASKRSENDTTPASARPGTPPTLKSLLMQDDSNRSPAVNKPPPSAKTSRKRKRSASRSSEDEEIKRYTQKMRTPVIRWKTLPWLEQKVTQEDDEEEQEDRNEKIAQKKQSPPTTSKKAGDSVDATKDAVQKPESSRSQADQAIDKRAQSINAKIDEIIDRNINKTSGRTAWSGKSAGSRPKTPSSRPKTPSSRPKTPSSRPKTPSRRPRDSVERVTETAERSTRESDVDKKSDIDKRSDSSVPRANSQLSSIHVHSTPEPASIYSDDSTWDSLVQNTAFELHEKRKSTGLALLEETYKKELAMSRRMKVFARKQKQKQLTNFLNTTNNLTMEEEELPLSKLYIRKLQQKRDLLDSLAKPKDKIISRADIDPKIVDTMEAVINAVAENRATDLYETHCEARASDDLPATSSVSAVPQPDRHQFYVDAEANANADWPTTPPAVPPTTEKEGMEEIASQERQSSNDDLLPEVDAPKTPFAVVNQDKVPLYDERNVEPDSSVTPEESRHFSDGEHAPSEDAAALRNFDIKVSVPKTLIKDDFSLGLLQRLNDTPSDAAGSELVGSTTGACGVDADKLEDNAEERDKIPQDPTHAAEEQSVAERDNSEEENSAKAPDEGRHAENAIEDEARGSATCELQQKEQESTDSAASVRPASAQIAAAAIGPVEKSDYSDVTENEDSGDSVAPNAAHEKTATPAAVEATTDIEHNSTSLDSATAKITNTEDAKKSDAESEQLSNDSIASKTDYQQAKDATAAKEDERITSESNSRTFEEIRGNDQRARSPVPIISTSDKSEESSETLTGDKRSSDNTTSSSSNLSFEKSVSAMKNVDTTRKSYRKRKHAPETLRRSSRYSNENVKPNKEDDNSNSSGLESNAHERDPTAQRPDSKSPTWTPRDEKIVNTSSSTRKNRAAQKTQTATNARKTTLGIESETRIDDAKDKTALAERKRKQHTQLEMANCKVKLIDCKHTLLKSNVSPEVLHKFGIVSVNSCVQTPHASLCPDAAAPIPAAASEKSDKPDDKDKFEHEVEVVHEKSTAINSGEDLVQTSTSHDIEVDVLEPVRIQYTTHKGPILDIKVFNNSFLAASEDGKIYRYSQTSTGVLNIYKGHKSAVTCLLIYKSKAGDDDHMYSGSLDGTLRCYNIKSGALMRSPAQIHSPIQCMDEAWGMIFIGATSGHVSRFHIKVGAVKGTSIQFSDKSVLALKATNEGPRKILIVASRNQPISIRDAQNGLFLRTISGQKSHTVYSLMRHHNLIYCGTSNTSINVFDFTLGEQTIQYDAGVGIVCMRLYHQLLFAGCYDGNIYVFDTRNHKLVCSIPGPGNMLLSIEVVNNKIIAGSKDKRLHSWQMPPQVRALL